MAQFVELDIFLEALERGVTGELLEAGDVDTLGDAARDRPAPQAVAGKRRRVEPGMAGPLLDDQRDRIGVDRVGAEAVARRCTLWLWHPWRRAAAAAARSAGTAAPR